MKANWKIALMCLATLAMVACKKDKNEPSGGGEGGGDEPTFVSKVNVKDNSIAEWATLPAEYVQSATCPEDGASLGLKSMKVYADQVYINILFEFDPEEYFDSESDIEDYKEDPESYEDEINDLKYEAFSEWLSDYVEGLSDDEARDFFYHHMGVDLNMDGVEYTVGIPEAIIAKAQV